MGTFTKVETITPSSDAMTVMNDLVQFAERHGMRARYARSCVIGKSSKQNKRKLPKKRSKRAPSAVQMKFVGGLSRKLQAATI